MNEDERERLLQQLLAAHRHVAVRITVSVDDPPLARLLDTLLDLVRRHPDVTPHVAGSGAAVRGWINEQLNHRRGDA